MSNRIWASRFGTPTLIFPKFFASQAQILQGKDIQPPLINAPLKTYNAH